MVNTAPRARYRIPTSTWVVLAVLCIFPVLFMAGSQYLDWHDNVHSRCEALPQPVGVSHSYPIALKSASVTAIPAGRLCVWDLENGGTASAQTGWPVSIAGIAATLLAAVATAIIFRRRVSIGQAMVQSLPTLVIILIWLEVIASASTTFTPRAA